MAYADPQSTSNPTTGQPILAAWGDIVRDDLEYVARNKPHCRVNRTTDQSIPNSTATAITFSAERYDVGGCHSTVTNTSRLTVPSGEAGKYIFGTAVSWAVNVTGVRQVRIVLNGTTLLAVDSTMAVTSGGGTEQTSCGMYSFIAGDYIEVHVNQGSGGALNIDGASSYSPEFWMMWMAI